MGERFLDKYKSAQDISDLNQFWKSTLFSLKRTTGIVINVFQCSGRQKTHIIKFFISDDSNLNKISISGHLHKYLAWKLFLNQYNSFIRKTFFKNVSTLKNNFHTVLTWSEV